MAPPSRAVNSTAAGATPSLARSAASTTPQWRPKQTNELDPPSPGPDQAPIYD